MPNQSLSRFPPCFWYILYIMYIVMYIHYKLNNETKYPIIRKLRVMYLIQVSILAGPILHSSPTPPDNNVSQRRPAGSNSRRSYENNSEHFRPPNTETVAVNFSPCCWYILYIIMHIHYKLNLAYY